MARRSQIVIASLERDREIHDLGDEKVVCQTLVFALFMLIICD